MEEYFHPTENTERHNDVITISKRRSNKIDILLSFELWKTMINPINDNMLHLYDLHSYHQTSNISRT